MLITLLQLIVMIGAARLMNNILRKLGQPGVIGEIVAGLLLGPTLFGHVFPQQSAALFGATASLPIVVISQLGLILLMFQIGSEFEFQHLGTHRNRRSAILIAAVSVAVPFMLGLAIGGISASSLAPSVDPLTYSLFLGVALSVTALPILGRILREFGLARTELGVVAIAAAALNDVAGWVMLAAVAAFASARFSVMQTVLQLGGLAVLALVLRFVLWPLKDRLLRPFPSRDGSLSANLIANVLCLAFALAVCTSALGIFSIFGGFAAGLLFHRDPAFVRAWRQQVGQFVLVFFLPVFFTYTGLRTNLLGLTSSADLLWLGCIVGIAMLGKLVPVYAVSRMCGFSGHESSILAALMNTRALMELIVINEGYDLGFLAKNVFTMLVIMAVTMTVITGPLLKMLLPRLGHEVPAAVEA